MNRQFTLWKLCVSFFIMVFAGGVSFQGICAELPEMSPEGLRLMPNTTLAVVYMREGADFSGYQKVAILDCVVAFRKHWKRDQNANKPFYVNDSDMTRIKTELGERLKTVFATALTEKGTTVVNNAGSDVLILRPAIINLDITAPDTMKPGVRFYSASAGQMTLYLEVFDSITGDLLARVVDRQQVADYGHMRVRNGVTNRADADRTLKQWADTLAGYLQHARDRATPDGATPGHSDVQ